MYIHMYVYIHKTKHKIYKKKYVYKFKKIKYTYIDDSIYICTCVSDVQLAVRGGGFNSSCIHFASRWEQMGLCCGSDFMYLDLFW